MSGVRSVIGVAVGVAAVIAGIVVINKLTRDDLERRGHFTVIVADLKVPPPPGMSRDDFLAEVMYQGSLPAKLDRTDPNFLPRLQKAFAEHPWVESVAPGDAEANPPVEIVLRVPALAVGGRVLDRNGVLLPLMTSTADLPTYRGKVSDTATPAGQKYPDPAIAAIATTIGWLHTQAPELKWDAAELTADGLVLIRKDGAKAIWGFAKPDEPSAETKLAKLKEWKGGAIDLRKGG